MRLTGSPETTNEGFSSRVISLHWEYCRPPGVIVRRLAKFGTPARRTARWGRLWGFAPFAAPLASPPKHPQEKFSASLG